MSGYGIRRFAYGISGHLNLFAVLSGKLRKALLLPKFHLGRRAGANSEDLEYALQETCEPSRLLPFKVSPLWQASVPG